MTAQLTPAFLSRHDPWPELAAMSDDECRSALAHLAGRDPGMFARVMEVTRPEREDGRARRAARMAR